MPEITTMPLEFLRPWWLFGIIAAIIYSFIGYKNSKKSGSQGLIAPHLSANIVTNTGTTQKRQFAFTMMAIIACISLSGPTWRSVDLPVYEMEKAQVIVFDLSYSMYATDIKPNRLSQAKYKAIDLIKEWSEGEKALIAYAGDAFTVTPLTRDGNAIINHIPHLSPDIMPVRGARADIALDKAIELLKNAGYSQGHIVFISDDIDAQQAKKMAKQLQNEKWIVSTLAVASEQGAPITLTDGSLLKNDKGEIVVPKLIAQPFYEVTRASNGLYINSRNDNADIKKLGTFFEELNKSERRENEADKAYSDQFSIDDGYWLAFLLLPLFLLLFRKGVFFALLLTLYLPLSSPSLEAAEGSVWKNSEQNAFQAYQDGQYERAVELYDSPLEQGSALYKNKQYEQALTQFTEATNQQPDNAHAFYNQGNSFAQLQQFDEALEAYDKALAIDPTLDQASKNKTLIEQIKEQKEQQEQQQDQNQQSDDKNNQDTEGDQEQQESEQQESEQQESEQQESEQQESEQQESEQQESEQQESEQQESKQQESKQQESEQQAQLTETDEELNQELEALPDWLKNMPDDPSILLRRKMQAEYQKRMQSQPVRQKTNNGVIW